MIRVLACHLSRVLCGGLELFTLLIISLFTQDMISSHQVNRSCSASLPSGEVDTNDIIAKSKTAYQVELMKIKEDKLLKMNKTIYSITNYLILWQKILIKDEKDNYSLQCVLYDSKRLCDRI